MRTTAIVCTYRREESLCDTLGDLLAQSPELEEILVVDQTPSHQPATEAFLQRHADRARVLRVEEPNLPNARNVGLAHANGDLVLYVDDDVRLPPDFVARAAAHFSQSEVDGLAPLVGSPDVPIGADAAQRYRLRAGWIARERVEVDSFIGACMVFRREVLSRAGGFDALLGRLDRSASGEDMELCRRLSRAGRRLWLAPGLRVDHRTDVPGGCEVRVGEQANTETRHVRALIYVILKEEGALEGLSPRAAYRVLRSTFLRRDVLRGGPRTWLRVLRDDVRRFQEVRSFWRSERQTALKETVRAS